MASYLPQLAQELGSDERTLRRWVRDGTVHASRPSPRKLVLATGERDYLRSHWRLLARLRRALRTEPSIQLAALYGSAARGDDRPDSDLDLLVVLDEHADTPAMRSSLGRRIERAAGRKVDVAIWDDVKTSSPLLAAEALREGRVLADRDATWSRLQRQRSALDRRVRREAQEKRSGAANALDELLG